MITEIIEKYPFRIDRENPYSNKVKKNNKLDKKKRLNNPFLNFSPVKRIRKKVPYGINSVSRSIPKNCGCKNWKDKIKNKV